MWCYGTQPWTNPRPHAPGEPNPAGCGESRQTLSYSQAVYNFVDNHPDRPVDTVGSMVDIPPRYGTKASGMRSPPDSVW